jgi:hypothetical protein
MSTYRYAQGTEVSADRSRSQIETALMRGGATAFAYGQTSDPPTARVMFEMSDRRFRFDLPLPNASDREFTHTARGQRRAESARVNEYQGEIKRRWRALLLVIKAKLEAVASGIATLEEEFLAHVVLPNGQTFYEWARPQLEITYAHGDMPEVMPGGTRAISSGLT